MSCKEIERKNFPLVLYNESSCQPILLYTETKLEGDYSLRYIGEWKDTVKWYHALSAPPPPIKKVAGQELNDLIKPWYLFENFRFEHYPNQEYDSILGNLNIIIDTTQHITIFHQAWELKVCFTDYPVLIQNTDTFDIDISIDEQVMLEIEALNENHEWVQIDKNYFVECGSGIETYTLHPQHICLTSMPKYDGDFLTKMRVRLGKNVSNEIDTKLSRKLLVP